MLLLYLGNVGSAIIVTVRQGFSVVTKVMLVVVVMVTVRQGFSVIIKAFMMVNDCWPAIILSTALSVWRL